MPRILDELARDHANIASALRVVERQLALLSQGSDPDYMLIELVLDYLESYADQWHHPTEDLVYAALDREPGAPGDVSRDLHEEHAGLSRLTEEFHQMIEDVLGEGVLPRERILGGGARFLEAYRSHMVSEERFLFPIAASTLDAVAWDGIAAHSERTADPVFGARGDDRFAALRDHIRDLERASDPPDRA